MICVGDTIEKCNTISKAICDIYKIPIDSKLIVLCGDSLNVSEIIHKCYDMEYYNYDNKTAIYINPSLFKILKFSDVQKLDLSNPAINSIYNIICKYGLRDEKFSNPIDKYFELLIQIAEQDYYKYLIYIDECEALLMPQNQIQLCKLMLNLIEKGHYIMASTNSPYIIQGIKHYSDRLKNNKYCVEYFMADGDQDNIEFCNVTDDLNRIFIKMARPFEKVF